MATIYKYNDYEYRDEAGEFTTTDVKTQLTQYFPELANAKAEESTDSEGNTVVTFVKRAGTKGKRPTTVAETRGDVPPLSDVELFKLEDAARCARNGKRTIELDPNQVLALIGEAWYLRALFGKPESARAADARL